MNRLKRLWWRLKLTDEETVFDVLDRLSQKTKNDIAAEFKTALDLAEKVEDDEIKANIRNLIEGLPKDDPLRIAIENTQENPYE